MLSCENAGTNCNREISHLNLLIILIFFSRIFEYNIDTNKLDLIDKYSYLKCLFCIRILKVKLSNELFISRLFCFGTDGYFLVCKLKDKTVETNEDVTELDKIKCLHQSGINGVDIWREESLSNVVVATVGDDTRVSIMEIDLRNEINSDNCSVFKRDMCHASAIVGNFLNFQYFNKINLRKIKTLNFKKG